MKSSAFIIDHYIYALYYDRDNAKFKIVGYPIIFTDGTGLYYSKNKFEPLIHVIDGNNELGGIAEIIDKDKGEGRSYKILNEIIIKKELLHCLNSDKVLMHFLRIDNAEEWIDNYGKNLLEILKSYRDSLELINKYGFKIDNFKTLTNEVNDIIDMYSDSADIEDIKITVIDYINLIFNIKSTVYNLKKENNE